MWINIINFLLEFNNRSRHKLKYSICGNIRTFNLKFAKYACLIYFSEIMLFSNIIICILVVTSRIYL